MKEIFLAVILSLYAIVQSHGQDISVPDTISVQSGKLTLKCLLWRPPGTGKFPTVIFCHGGYETDDTTYDPVQNTSTLGQVFAQKGFLFLGVLRRGTGLSRGQGENSADLMAKAFRENGQRARNKVQLEHLETDQLQDMLAGLSFLLNRKDVDARQIVIVGHSFGGSLALLVAEHEPELKAAVIFSGAGFSWDRSPELRLRLIRAVQNISIPVMIIHAQNDYSLNPGYGLDSVLNQLHKPHLLKIYPKFGNTNREAHNLVFLSTRTWEADVFKFLNEVLRH